MHQCLDLVLLNMVIRFVCTFDMLLCAALMKLGEHANDLSSIQSCERYLPAQAATATPVDCFRLPHLPSVGTDDTNVTLFDSSLALGVCEQALQQLEQGHSLLCIEEAWGISLPPLQLTEAKLEQSAGTAKGHVLSQGAAAKLGRGTQSAEGHALPAEATLHATCWGFPSGMVNALKKAMLEARDRAPISLNVQQQP